MKFLRSIIFRILKSILSIIILLFVAIIGIWVWQNKPWIEAEELNKSKVKVNVERMKQEVKLFSERFSPRSYKDHVFLLAAGKTIQKRFESTKGKVELQKFKVLVNEKGKKVPREFFNVSCIFGEGNGKRLIIGAHYDGYDITPGADDNASGIAGLLELAYMFDAEDELPCELELVAYSLEEPPFFGTDQMGSSFHADKMIKDKVDVIGVIVLDMIGYFTDEVNSQDYPSPLLKMLYPSVGNFIAVVGNLEQETITSKIKSAMMGVEGLAVESINAPAILPGVDFSDHRNYWSKGYQAVMITDTAFYRNKAYHTQNDTWDRLDYDMMAKVIEGLFSAVILLAEESKNSEIIPNKNSESN